MCHDVQLEPVISPISRAQTFPSKLQYQQEITLVFTRSHCFPTSRSKRSRLTAASKSSLQVQCLHYSLNRDWKNSSPSILSVTSKFGLDGSGCHIRHQKLDNDDVPGTLSTNYFGAFWCPLQLKANDEVVWENPLPNSTLYCRPVCLMRGKETRENVEDHFKPIMDDILRVEEESSVITNGTAHDLSVQCEISMIDGKMVDLIQGDSGSFCHYCDARVKLTIWKISSMVSRS